MVGLPRASDLPRTEAWGISADDNVIVGRYDLQPAIWLGDAMPTALGTLPGHNQEGVVFAASADGSSVVGYTDT